jgi:hypothetical protein
LRHRQPHDSANLRTIVEFGVDHCSIDIDGRDPQIVGPKIAPFAAIRVPTTCLPIDPPIAAICAKRSIHTAWRFARFLYN